MITAAVSARGLDALLTTIEVVLLGTIVFVLAVAGKLAVDTIAAWATSYLERRREDRELFDCMLDWPVAPPFREEPVDFEGAIDAMGGRYLPAGDGRVA